AGSWAEGTEMTEEDGAAGGQRGFGRGLGEQLGEVDEGGELIVDAVLLILLNAHHEPLTFILPPAREGERWELVVDTGQPELAEGEVGLEPGAHLEMAARSLTLLRGVASA